MIRKLETGEYLLERDRAGASPNRIRPIDAKAEARHKDNKQALFKKM